MRRGRTAIAIIILVLGASFVKAEDTIAVQDTVASVMTLLPDADSIKLYPDTFKLAEQREYIPIDELLLKMVSEQRHMLHDRDSVANDSLYADILQRDSLLVEYINGLRDSLENLRRQADSIRQIYHPVIVEPIDSVAIMMDSIELQLNAVPRLHGIEIEKSWINDPVEDYDDVLRAIRNKYSNWYKEGTTMLQLTQNYISHNWYKGGNSNFAVLTLLKGEINYRKDNISWENTGEWRTGISTVSGDSLRKANVTDDLFKLYSNFGYRFIDKCYASTQIEFQTTLWNIWNTNTKTVKTAFMTPLRFNVSLGLDYKPIKGMSIVFAPLTYKMVYAYYGDSTSMVDVKNYGIEEGNKILNELGSSLRVKYQYRPVREIALDTEFYLYTNYHKVEIDWEVNCNFIINRFLSARLTLHPRFDNTVIQSGDDKAKLQFKELLSIGFAHKFH